ncbi:MAG: cytochrome c oxidase cbb3-type subunit I/II [Neolewinella sp.]|jgi:cytochrome c oxidase cbb3-type subunit I/II
MPDYSWLLTRKLNNDLLPAKIRVLQMLGTPYDEGYDERAITDAAAQATRIATSLRNDGIKDTELEQKEIVAMIAYLQRLGTDIKNTK